MSVQARKADKNCPTQGELELERAVKVKDMAAACV
jgi:hypothetical protein